MYFPPGLEVFPPYGSYKVAEGLGLFGPFWGLSTYCLKSCCLGDRAPITWRPYRISTSPEKEREIQFYTVLALTLTPAPLYSKTALYRLAR